MADRDALRKGYAYHEMSNKIQQADRSQRRNRNEGTGEAESLRNRSDIGKMGDRVSGRGASDELVEMKKKTKSKSSKKQPRGGGDGDDVDEFQQQQSSSMRKKQKLAALTSGGASILDMDISGYQPSTPAAMAAYEKMLVRSDRYSAVMVSVVFC